MRNIILFLMFVAVGATCYVRGTKHVSPGLDNCPFPPRSENIKFSRKLLAQMLESPKLQVLMHNVDAEPNGAVRVDALYCEAFQ